MVMQAGYQKSTHPRHKRNSFTKVSEFKEIMRVWSYNYIYNISFFAYAILSSQI
jgi:hypothetical protein